MTKDISQKVKKTVDEHLGVEKSKVAEESNYIDDLGAASLDIVELVMSFEEEFVSDISNSEEDKILTFEAAIKLIESKSA